MSTHETCRSCGKAVVMLRHRMTQKLAPIEVEPVPNGNVQIHDDRTYSIITAGQELPAGTPRYVNHFATCPKAKEWRGKHGLETTPDSGGQ